MTPLTRTWLAFAALGAGLIHLAIGASADLPLAVALAGLGIAELGWGVLIMIRGRLLAPRWVVPFALAPVLLWGGFQALGAGLGLEGSGTTVPLFSLAVASAFDLFVAVMVATVLRRRGRSAVTPPADQGWRFLVGLVAAGMLVAGLTTPALAATDAGSQAVPHGSHGTDPAPSDDGHSTDDGDHSHDH